MNGPRVACHVRRAREADVPAMFRLLRELAAVTGQSGKFVSSEESLHRYGFATRPPLFEALLAEQDHGVVGLCLYFVTYSSWLGEPGIYVQDLVVDPAARGGGVGRRLLAMTAASAGKRGATHLRLSVEADNEAARGFYERLGFEYRENECLYHAGGRAFRNLAGEL